ncbi:MAG: glucose 1-dehydrogenase [Chloroflexi bacterium]|nr:glucose 1-dehydrogenase [Chloroflexota bacterium]
MRLKGKVAVITGATAGMGRASAVLFAREGAKVVMCGRRKELGEEIAKGIREEGGEVIFVQADVSKSEDVKRVIKAAVDTYGKLDVLFNNAGINHHEKGDPDQEPEEVWDNIIDVNLKGVFLGIKYAVPEMRKVGGGSIINNSSVNDTQADEVSMSSYHASKGGVTALTKKAAVVYAVDNIRVNAVNPGPIATELVDITWDQLNDPEIIEMRKTKQPLRRMGHPMDVAYAALYFASDESAFVTGATLLIDGGQSAAYRDVQ